MGEISPIQAALMELQDAEKLQDSREALVAAAAALEKLTAEDRGKLLQMPAVNKLISDAEERASKAGEAGSVICDARGFVVSRIPETAEHMKETQKMVKWTPMQSRMVSVNGVNVYVTAGREMTTPEIFRDIAMEAWQAEQNQLNTAKQIMKNNFGDNAVILFGDGTPA